ncbi:MAG: hypothetical protein IIZ28_06180 [Erysipelotrichaceae bacterium]|nr:hypothetical protein [Erysipelotrichaceae bacterium]
MDEKLKQVQEAFILSYVRKQRRERLSYELNSDKKRYEGLERFCHQAEDLLDPCRIILSGTDLFKRKEFLTFIEKHRKEDCFLLSPDAAFDQKEGKLEDVMEELFYCMDACMLIGKDFAYVRQEAMKGGTLQFLLKH